MVEQLLAQNSAPLQETHMPRHFLVQRGNLNATRSDDADALQPRSGEAVIGVERFALTANNITYGVAGDMIGYWKFFPAQDDWGRIPVWGIGRVMRSAHPDLVEGTRSYGYFPMSDEVCVKPEKVNTRGFKDGAAHRAELPPVYNQYTAVNDGRASFDNHAMVTGPFHHVVSLDDYLADNAFFGAQQIILRRFKQDRF